LAGDGTSRVFEGTEGGPDRKMDADEDRNSQGQTQNSQEGLPPGLEVMTNKKKQIEFEKRHH
jgi:hypothetical protein